MNAYDKPEPTDDQPSQPSQPSQPDPKRGKRPAPRRAGPERKTVGRGTSLPSGRASLGALLITFAGLGLYLAAIKATAAPTSVFVVATADLPPEHVVAEADLATIELRLSPELASRTFSDVSSLVGTRTLGPIGRGELLQAGNIMQPKDGQATREISFSIETARALNGNLRSGERIDVVATTGSGDTARTFVAVSGALVTGVSGNALDGPSDEIVVSISLRDLAEELAVAEAVNNAQLVLARSTEGTDPDTDTDTDTDPGRGPVTQDAQQTQPVPTSTMAAS